MHTLSSARRTCMASSSAVEWTATVAMPSSLQARNTRSAISPRLAMRILSNIWRLTPCAGRTLASFNDHERLPVFDRLAVFDENLDHGARPRGGNLIHRLHRLDDHERLPGFDRTADVYERPRAGLGCEIGSADHRRGHHA